MRYDRRMNTPRRTLLSCLPVATLVASPALAFRLEAPSAGVAAEYGGGACAEQQVHEALRAEMCLLARDVAKAHAALAPAAAELLVGRMGDAADRVRLSAVTAACDLLVRFITSPPP